MILAGDVGGTKTNLGWFRVEGGRPVPTRIERYENDRYDSLLAVARDFTAGEGARVACFGIAGPVESRTVAATNLPWEIDAGELERGLGIERVVLVNDLVATGEGLASLSDDDVEVLWPGAPGEGAVHLLVAAGTGFGAALLVPRDGALVALPSEGGHMDFAPRNPEEQALALFLRERHGRASIERVVSGPGIEDTYEFLAARGFADEPVARRAPGRDLAEVVSELALERRSPRAQAALRIFVSAYGAAAGNLVLAAFALGGVWIGGGIAPKIAPLLRDGVFRDALVAKGRMRPLLERVPIRLVKNPRTALFGAARLAAAAAP